MTTWASASLFTITFLIEYSFLIRYYSLLYQSLIPNCKLTISTLRHHIAISDNMEQYIIGAANQRTSCQRLINFLLTCLDSKKDYMQFCHHINIITVINDLSDRLIAGLYMLIVLLFLNVISRRVIIT